MASDNLLLRVQDVTGGYNRHSDILHAVSLEVRSGEICSVIGPNGAGKSTLFKFIYGLLFPKSGEIYFDGEPLTRLDPIKRLGHGICYVPQGRSNFPLMTVHENLEMGAFTRRDKNIDRDIHEIMERFPVLGRKAQMLAGNLSGGEQQMLEMGMALVLHPRLLLLDEPSLGLAPLIVRAIFEQIKQINANGITIMMVEQNARQALEVSNHAVVLALGRKRYEGTGQEIMANEEVKRLYLGG